MNAFAPTFDDKVFALLATGDSLYVGGFFTPASTASPVAASSSSTPRRVPSTRPSTPTSTARSRRSGWSTAGCSSAASSARSSLALNPGHRRQHRLHQHRDHRTVAANAGQHRRLPLRRQPAGHPPRRDRQLHLGRRPEPQPRVHARPRRTSATLNSWYYQPLANTCRAAASRRTCATSTSPPTAATSSSVATGFVPVRRRSRPRPLRRGGRFETNIAEPVPADLDQLQRRRHLPLGRGHGRGGLRPGPLPRPRQPERHRRPGTWVVAPQGIGAIDPVSGRALPWNPGKTRGVGGKDFLATPAGCGSPVTAGCSRRVARQHRLPAAVTP